MKTSRHLVLVLEKTDYNFFGVTISKSVGRKIKDNGQLAFEKLYDAYPSTRKLLVPVDDFDVTIRSGLPLKGFFIMTFVRFVKGETDKWSKTVMKVSPDYLFSLHSILDILIFQYDRKLVPETNSEELNERLNKLFGIANEIRLSGALSKLELDQDFYLKNRESKI